jgi:hypothetical protein
MSSARFAIPVRWLSISAYKIPCSLRIGPAMISLINQQIADKTKAFFLKPLDNLTPTTAK